MPRRLLVGLIVLGTLAATVSVVAAARGPRTVQVNVSSNEVAADDQDTEDVPSISRTGRFVAFSSDADNLVGHDDKGRLDIFVRDHRLGRTFLISQSSNEVGGNHDSFDPSISGSGRFVAFASSANNLTGAGSSPHPDVFVRDRRLGRTYLVSQSSNEVPGNSSSYAPAISANGRFVAFESAASNLTGTDTDTDPDVFLRDMLLGRTYLVSQSTSGVAGDFFSGSPGVSKDGRFVAFHSTATNLTPGNTDGNFDVYVRDMKLGLTHFVSQSSGGVKGEGHSSEAEISANGRFVVFTSEAPNLVPGDSDTMNDVYMRDLRLGRTYLISQSSNEQDGNGGSFEPSVSGNGRYITFSSFSTNLTGNDTDTDADIYLRDLRRGTTHLISQTTEGVAGDAASFYSDISRNGRFVTFISLADNMSSSDNNALWNIFRRGPLR